MRRVWYGTAASVLVLGLLGAVYWANGFSLYPSDKQERLPVRAGDERLVPALAESVDLVLERSYLCGVKAEEHKRVQEVSLEQILADYKEWNIVSVEPGKIVLQKQENDIAPVCKENGYFGLSSDEILTLFDGLPAEQKVIQTFYRINTKKMEASLPKEEVELLRKGIRVRDLAEYNSILSTYGEFRQLPDGNSPVGH